jgi:hypothetical protein
VPLYSIADHLDTPIPTEDWIERTQRPLIRISTPFGFTITNPLPRISLPAAAAHPPTSSDFRTATCDAPHVSTHPTSQRTPRLNAQVITRPLATVSAGSL